jgi:hypothetical protein
MTTTVIKNTHIKELMQIASGNMEPLKKMTEEFRRLVEEPFKGAERSTRNPQFTLNPAGKTYTISISAESYRRGHRIVITIE